MSKYYSTKPTRYLTNVTSPKGGPNCTTKTNVVPEWVCGWGDAFHPSAYLAWWSSIILATQTSIKDEISNYFS